MDERGNGRVDARRHRIEAIAAEAQEWRRDLHQHPQTSYEETFASDLVCAKLTEWGIPHERGLAQTGVVATIEGVRNHSNRVIAFRADMDALNITEASGQPWSSETPGKMHACGHDGHTATLLALAKYLHETRNFDGLVRLIFQPAEEGDGGAYRMLDEGLLERFPFDEVYGYHNMPTLPLGSFVTRPGRMMAAADIFTIELTGRGGHAGMPHLTVDPLPAAAHLVLALQTIVSRELDPTGSAVVSVTNLQAGTGADNIIGDAVRMTGTVRTFERDVRDRVELRMRAMAEGVAAVHGLTCKVVYERRISAVVNDPEATGYCLEAARRVAGAERVAGMDPVMVGEDFGGYLDVRPGAFMFIGQAEADPASPHSAMVHTARYDFNDKVIPIAATYFAELAETRLRVD